jgi:hypothetical protein
VSVGKALASTDAAPFWIGIAVTLVVAVTTSIVLYRFNTAPFGPGVDDTIRKRLTQYLTRDFDAVQSAAGVVSVVASALLLLHFNSTEGAIAFSFGVAFVLVVLLILFRVSAADYSHYAKGPFTPLVVALLVLNVLGLVLVVVLH